MSQRYRFVKSARIIALFTLTSRIFGVAREMTYSHFFGASPILSAYRVAFQVPNLARRLFGEGALASSFIPVFARHRAKKGDKDARRLAGGVTTLFTALLAGLLIVIECGLLVARVFTWNETLALTAILMPYMVLICLTALLGGMLNALDRFAAPALAPTILNVMIIIVAWSVGTAENVSPQHRIMMIAGSVIVAGVLQLSFQAFWLWRIRFFPELNFNWSDPAVKGVLTLMTPMVLGMSAVQINTLADSLIALLMVPDGRGPAILGYAQYLYHLPLGIFGTALATAIFPLLARRAADEDSKGFTEAIETGLRTTLFISIPAGVGLILVGMPVVRVLFEHGEFTPQDTQRVTRTLICYATAIWAYAAQHILIRAFYSLHDSRSPFRIAVSMVLLNVTLNLVLVAEFREAGVAAATAVSAVIQTVLLSAGLRARLGSFPIRPVCNTVWRTLIATGLMVAGVLAIQSLYPSSTTLKGDLMGIAIAIVAGASIFAMAARIMRLEELGAFLAFRSIKSESTTS